MSHNNDTVGDGEDRILRSMCSINFKTPLGGGITLPVNCANNSDSRWPWKNYWAKTVGSGKTTPVNTGGIEQNNFSFNYEDTSPEGQVVIRAAFAYIATQPIYGGLNVSVKMNDDGGTPDDGGGGYSGYGGTGENYTSSSSSSSTGIWNPNYEIKGSLHDSTGAAIETLFDTTDEFAEERIVFPATSCPKILWVFAKAQPSTTTTAFPYPTCKVTINFA